jgi:hypothetical protein
MGEPASTVIMARNRWNKTAFTMKKGVSYRFTAHGVWADWHTESPATGYTSPLLACFGWLRRMPRAKWFSLIGVIEKNRRWRVDIGRLIEEGLAYTAPASGLLYCYANDVWFMYFNNRGQIELEMEEVCE